MASKTPLLSAILSAAMLLSVPAYAIDDGEPRPAEDLIHSDVPLFGDETDKWPQQMDGGDIGCRSRVGFGDWVLRRAGDETDEYPTWYRIRNYGMIHCWAMVTTAVGEREGLDNRTGSEASFFVMLETVGSRELWAFQIGARPGSDYLLLSREPTPELVTSFSVLQRECPEGNVRNGQSLDTLRTDYCAINSPAELRQLARRMLEKKPLGTLTLVPDLEAPEIRPPPATAPSARAPWHANMACSTGHGLRR